MQTQANTASPIANPADPADPFADMRGAQRFSLLIRTAKLVSESGELPCVVRDVSETGLRLKLFQPLPVHPRMAIELANGAFYFIERVWEQGDHAGFRFSALIDVHAFIEEPSPWPRRPVRLRIALPAVISAAGIACPVRMVDLSQAGARVQSSQPLALRQRVRLEAEGLPPLIANVCWRSGKDHGLAFQQSFGMAELAQLVAGLQAPAPVHAQLSRA